MAARLRGCMAWLVAALLVCSLVDWIHLEWRVSRPALVNLDKQAVALLRRQFPG